MKKYIEKPEVVEAVQVSAGKDTQPGQAFVWGDAKKGEQTLWYKDQNGLHVAISGKRAGVGDYIVRHADGEVEVVNKARFEAEFESSK